ncbi:MAG: hypothetical protein ACKVW3_02235 [Phycisphaerales bacterium]
MHRFASVSAVALGIASGCVSVRAQSDSPPTAEGAALAGPKVSERSTTTLIERDFAGKVKRLDTPPEEASLALLDLDEATRAATTRILNERAAIMDGIVRDNIDLLLKFVTARQGGDRAAIVSLLGEFNAKLEPLRARGELVDEIHDALPPAMRGRFTTLVTEYRKAVTDEAAGEAKTKGERARPRAAAMRERLADLGLEVKRSYERLIGAGQRDFEALIEELQLAPEQETKVRNLAQEYVQKTKGKPTPAQQRQLVTSIMAHLTPEQNKVLLSKLAAARGEGQTARMRKSSGKAK